MGFFENFCQSPRTEKQKNKPEKDKELGKKQDKNAIFILFKMLMF
jgi:hypothetical protein